MNERTTTSGYGVLRIHLRARDHTTREGPWWRRLGRGRHASYRIVQWAHQAGLPTAMVHRVPVGFVNHGPIIDDTLSDHPNPHALVVVEIGGPEAELRSFVHRHRAALLRAHLTFQPLEHWTHHIGHHDPQIGRRRTHHTEDRSR